MVSAPKKPRTGDAPTVDEQLRVEEMPVADGDPPADAPCLEEESNSDVPYARPPPRLPPKGCVWLQLFMAKEHRRMQVKEPEQPRLSPACALLVNRSFLNAFFDAEIFSPAKIVMDYDETVKLCKTHRYVLAFTTSIEGIVTLLQLAREMTTLEVKSDVVPSRFTFGLMCDWMQVAAKVRDCTSLTAIHLTVRWLTPFMDPPSIMTTGRLDMLVDSLPDKITRVEADGFRIATLFRKRTPLESVKLDARYDEHFYLADVFRLKSTRIELLEMRVPQLHDCGPLDRNEHLQELHVPAGTVNCEEAVRHLRAINAHFKLTWHTSFWTTLYEPRPFKSLEGVVWRDRKLAAAMRDAGFETSDAEVRNVITDGERWQYVSRDQAVEHFKWKREQAMPCPDWWGPVVACTHVHRGIRILVVLKNGIW